MRHTPFAGTMLCGSHLVIPEEYHNFTFLFELSATANYQTIPLMDGKLSL
jgi:hypothetical protein